MEAGDYQEAIDVYSYENRKQPRDQQILHAYAKSLDDIKSKADHAYAKKDFASAGRLYYVLHKNYSKFGNVAKMISFNKAYLNARLTACKKSLSVQGFQEYRDGRLGNALALWQSVLDIDPNNKDIKEAMRTARQQQKNLAQDK
jgi:tetratricopeptide (TPR) repeat protein